MKTDYGYHIIKVTKRTQKTVEKNKDEIKQAYLLEHANSYNTVIEKLKKKSNVTIKNKDLKESMDKLFTTSTTSTSQTSDLTEDDSSTDSTSAEEEVSNSTDDEKKESTSEKTADQSSQEEK
ncbi:hypothetical protein SFC65_24425 [Priestia filamentosa]|uniref:peptidylprolyl isomerase n=1 Tax=Priestia filamentosa TaxID=1402861 RepID=UPI003982BF66